MEVSVKSNWAENEEEQISKSIIVHDSPKFEFDPDSVDLSSCIELKRPEEGGGQPCHIELRTSRDSSISRFVLASQAKRCEIYKLSGEYLSTHVGKMLDDSDEEFMVFVIDASLEMAGLTGGMLIKLPSVPDTAWLLGMHISVEKSKPKGYLDAAKSFDLTHLDSLLKSGKSDLSANAKEFKHLFEQYQQAPPPAMLAMSNLPQNQAGCETCGLKMAQMEARIMKRLDEMEQKQQMALEKITKAISPKMT